MKITFALVTGSIIPKPCVSICACVYIYYPMKHEMLHVNAFIRCILCTIFCVMCKTDFARTCQSQVCRALEWINMNEKWKRSAKWLNRPVIFTLNTNINFFLIEQKYIYASPMAPSVSISLFTSQPTVWPTTNDVLVSSTIGDVIPHAPCDWTKYFPFPVVDTHTWRSATETDEEEKNTPNLR